jgi:hypothetical protein
MNSIRDAGNWISHKTQGGAHAASKEANKQFVIHPLSDHERMAD